MHTHLWVAMSLLPISELSVLHRNRHREDSQLYHGIVIEKIHNYIISFFVKQE